MKLRLGMASHAWILAGQNAVWLCLLTVNQRIVNAHMGNNLLLVAVTQLIVSFAYFTILKSIQVAKTPLDIIFFCVGGSVGSVVAVVITWSIR